MIAFYSIKCFLNVVDNLNTRQCDFDQRFLSYFVTVYNFTNHNSNLTERLSLYLICSTDILKAIALNKVSILGWVVKAINTTVGYKAAHYG